MGSAFNHPSSLNNVNHIGTLHCGKTVRNDNGCSIFSQTIHCVFNQTFCFRIERAGGFIK